MAQSQRVTVVLDDGETEEWTGAIIRANGWVECYDDLEDGVRPYPEGDSTSYPPSKVNEVVGTTENVTHYDGRSDLNEVESQLERINRELDSVSRSLESL